MVFQQALLLSLIGTLLTFVTLPTCVRGDIAVESDGSTTSYTHTPSDNVHPPDLRLATTWSPLDAGKRANLYLAATAAGIIGDESLMPPAILMEVGEFDYGGNTLVRGAKATADMPAEVFASIDPSAQITLQTVTKTFTDYGGIPGLRTEVSSPEFLQILQNPSEERAMLTFFLLRESSMDWSPYLPYIRAFLDGASQHIPSSWDPSTPEGRLRRNSLGDLEGGKSLLTAVDELRNVIIDSYANMLPKALELFPNLLGVNELEVEGIREVYSLQKYIEMWLSIRSRSLEDGGYGILCPMVCLLNHPPKDTEATVEIRNVKGRIVMKTTRVLEKGEELTYSYGDLTAERALLVYGFPHSVWSTLPSIDGFYE